MENRENGEETRDHKRTSFVFGIGNCMGEIEMNRINWGQLEAIRAGKKRNDAVIVAAAAFLSDRRKDDPALSTLELAYMLCPENASAVGKLLTRIAPELPAYATHDGDAGKRYGKSFVRWRWHGTRET